MASVQYDCLLSEEVMHDHLAGDIADLTATLDPRYLKITSNLSDLNNVATARTNLGLVAGGAGDIWVEKAGDTMTGALTITPSANGTSILNVTDQAGTSVLNVDTTNRMVGIGTTAPATMFEIESTNGSVLSISNTTAGSAVSPVEGKLQFRGYNNNIRAEIAGQDQATNYNGGWLQFRTQDSSSVLKDRMIIDRTGNVGIGTTGPEQKLDVQGGNIGVDQGYYVLNRDDTNTGMWFERADRILFQAGGENLLDLNANGAQDFIKLGDGGDVDLYLSGGADPALFVEGSSGNVGIGTTSPGAVLDVYKSQAAGYTLQKLYGYVDNAGGSQTYIGSDIFTSANQTANVYGQRISIESESATPVINAYGLYIGAFGGAGNITNRFGVYQAGSSEKNYFAGNVGIGTTAPAGRLHINGTADDQQLIIEGHSTQTLNLTEWWNSSGTTLAFITPLGGAVFNETGADADFRVEGDTDSNLLFVDASADKVGIGKNNPAYKLDVTGEINATTGYRVNGTAGATGTFTTADAKTVTVTGGIITQIL